MAVLVVVALGLDLGTGPAEGATSSNPPAAHPAGSCKCRTCRQGTCCCGHRAVLPEVSPEPVSTPAPKLVRATDGPCVGQAPCGDPASPDRSPSGPSSKAASLAREIGPAPDAEGRPLPPDDARGRPSTSPSRLDDPPESSPLA